MTRIVQSLAEVGGAYEALLVDLWGCYHDGIAPWPAAMAALRDYRARGGIVILLTNAPRPAYSVKRFLERIGAAEDSYDGIMSSGAACRRAIRRGEYGQRFHYVGPPRDLHMLTDLGLEDLPLEQAGAILCTGLVDDMTETPADYAGQIAEWRAHGLTLLCANPDLVVDRGERRLFCAGSIARAYERAGGAVVWFGKPHAPTYDQSFDLLAEIAGRDIPRDKVLAIGDGIGTDVKGGLDYGLDVMFVSGGLAAAETGGDPEHPDPARLEAYLAAHGVAPQFAIGRLR
jgi:HAD superfamily hydrolase (TIGR01459 family)